MKYIASRPWSARRSAGRIAPNRLPMWGIPVGLMPVRTRGGMRLPTATRAASLRGLRDQLAEPLERELDLAQRRAEREPQVAAEPRRAPAAALAGVDVEELAGHRDHLLGERGPEEAHAVGDRRRQVLRRGPDVERALRRQVDREPEIA